MARRLCLLLAVWTGWVAGQSSPYCSFTSQHTLCKFSGVGPRCGSQVMARGVGAPDAAAIVAQHNQLRSRVAMGQEPRGDPGPQPQAANMRLLEWDDELAVVAQGHADQCVFEHECADCRRVSRFGVGQNLFISFQSNFDTGIQWERAIKAWYDEVVDFSPSDIQPFQFSTAVGHYTQMMWWNTFKVGCGFTMFEEGGWWKKLYTCNYGPGGNIIFSQMYKRGSPCSSCPEGTSCSAQYPGLCENSSDSSRAVTSRPATTTTTFPVNSDDNNQDNTIPVLPATDNNSNNGFNGFIDLNKINPNDVDLNALITFFNNRRRVITGRRPSSPDTFNPILSRSQRPALITARPTAPPPTTTTPTPPSTTNTTTTTTTTTTQPPPPPPSTTTTVAPPTTTPTTTTTIPPTTTTTNSPTTTNTTSTSTTTPSSPQGPAFAPSFTTNQVLAGKSGAPAGQQEQDKVFIPIRGSQPTSSDLMPFLRRAGMNTQIIRTSSLSSVQSILKSLPANLDPIILFRSGSGQLTELNATTLEPLQRFGRSTTTTTRGPKRRPGALLICDLDFSPCQVTPVGGNWTVGDSDSEGMFAEGLLEAGEGSQVVVEELVEAPSSEAVCVALSHRRALTHHAPANATIPELQVGVMPLGGELNRRPVLGAPGIWEMSRVTLRNVKTPFLLVMTVGPATDPATIGLDAVMVTDGVCCLSGRC